MTMRICFTAKKNCYASGWSYGEICVGCGCCAEPSPERVEARYDYWLWEWVVLDPPYQITRVDVKLNGYGLKGAVASDVIFRRNLKHYFQRHTENIVWLDICAPSIKGFYRKKLWLVLTGGFHTVRVLSWLQREMKPLL